MKRIDKFNAFQEFKSKSKEIFEYISEHDKGNLELKKLYGFYVAPGSRRGGQDSQIVEVFYGHRPIRVKKVIDQNLQLSQFFITENGAELYYMQLDNGNVHVSIYPAWTEELKPIEEFVIVDYIKNPKKLLKKSIQKKHYKWLKSYMAVTSIERDYSFIDKVRVSYLRLTKSIFKNKVSNEPKLKMVLLNGLKLIFTVGFSGFLLAIIPYIVSNNSKNKDNETYKEILINQKELILLIKDLPTKTNNLEIINKLNELIEKEKNINVTVVNKK